MIKRLLMVLLFGFSIAKTFAQEQSYNVLCRKFTYNGNEKCDGCRKLKTLFETALSNPKYKLNLVEREDLDKVFETINEENNLAKDLSNEQRKKLELAKVDYLILGNLEPELPSGYELDIKFVNVSEKYFTTKLPLVIHFTEQDYSNDSRLIKIFEDQTDSFVNSRLGLFVARNSGDSARAISQLVKEMKLRDSIKEQEILDIKNYANIARLDEYGVEMHYVGGIGGPRPELLGLMEKVWERRSDGGSYVRISDESFAAINTAIEKYPKFPFSYYAKAAYLISTGNRDMGMLFAQKAYRILKITTSIEGHKPVHDAVLISVKQMLQGKDQND